MIKWGKMPPGGSAQNGYIFEGLIQCLVWYDSELAGFKVKFRGPDGIGKELFETFGDIKQARQMAEKYLHSLINKDTSPGPGTLALTLTGPENELLGHATIDYLNPLYNLGDSYLVDAISHQATILAHLWLAAERKRKQS